MRKMVRDLMNPNIITCPPEATLGQVAVTLYDNHVHALFVAGVNAQILGVITDFDLLAGEWLSSDEVSQQAMRKMTAGELMSAPVGTIDADVSADRAAKRMRQEVIRRLLVVDDGKPVGVISVSDFIANVAEKAQSERRVVADVMSDVFLTCRENTPVTSAARAMAHTGWRSVLVVDPRGRALGVFSGLDLLALGVHEDYSDKVVSQAMHPLLTIDMQASLHEAASKMIENHHHRLAVIDPNAPDTVPLGMISSYDIVAEMARPGSIWQS